ncbi:hypothetical protein BH11GEM2_BH11GEM2_14280 [soil metagenome]
MIPVYLSAPPIRSIEHPLRRQHYIASFTIHQIASEFGTLSNSLFSPPTPQMSPCA